MPAGSTRESLRILNAETARWLRGERPSPPAVLLHPRDSPVWSRALSSPADAEPHPRSSGVLAASLSALGVKRLVVGHTPQAHANAACGGGVWRIDTGMGAAMGGGAVEALEITPGGGVRVPAEPPPLSLDYVW